MNFVKQLPNNLKWLCPINCELIRLGDPTDGGYLVPQLVVDKADSLLSLGLGENWSFDEDWHRLRPSDPIHLYDGEKTKRGFSPPDRVWNRTQPLDLISMYENFFVDQRRHWVENIGLERGDTSFATAITRLNGNATFLKMDIEGGEYPIIGDILRHRHKIIGIAAEFHSVNTNREQFQTTILHLKAEYDIVHMHANITLPVGPEGLTEGLEITWLRKDLSTNRTLRHRVYHDLDKCNFLNFPDFEYWFEP